MAEPIIGNVTWTTIYDAASGVAPTDATWGFTQVGTFDSTSTVDNWHRMTVAYTGSAIGKSYYSKSNCMPNIVSGKVLITHIRAKLHTGHRYSTTIRYGWSGLTNQGYDELHIRGDWSSWNNTQWAMNAFGGILVPKNLFTPEVAFDLILIWRLTGTDSPVGSHEIWKRDVGSYEVNSAAGYVMAGRNSGYGSSTNQFIFGDYYDGYGADWSVSFIRAGVTDDAQILSDTGLPIFETPSVVPKVLITVSPIEIAVGETASATATIEGNSLVTLNGSSWDGSSTEIVTATEAGGVTPPNTPTTFSIVTAPNRPTYIGIL